MNQNIENDEPECQLINCYKVFNELGHGTFGKVYLVRTVTDDVYAMKISNGNMAKYIKIEEDFLKKLGPYNIAPKVVDSFDYKDKYCLVMTNCEQKLSEFIQRNLTLSQIKTLMKIATQQVKVLHGLNIIHADIKTDNFLIETPNDEKTLKIIDFSSSLQMPRETMPTKLQSRYFKAPEVLHKCKYNFKIDMWSLGCLFYEIVFKRPMFPSKTDDMLALQQMSVLGVPEYGLSDYFRMADDTYYAQNQKFLTRYNIPQDSPKLPTQNVIWSIGRPECEPRDMMTKINKETSWSRQDKENFHTLLMNLITYDQNARWNTDQVLACDFLK